MKLFQAFLVLIIGCIALAATPPAQAHNPIPGRCALHMPADSTLEDALAARPRCTPGDLSLEGPRIWVFTDLAGTGTAERNYLLGDPSDISGLSVFAHIPGSGWRGDRYTPEEIVDNWRSGMHYAVPIDARASELVIAIDRPWHPDAISLFEVATAEQVARVHYSSSIAYAVFIGILTVPILYNLVFYGVMRQRFMLWHIGISVGVLGYAMLSSGLVFLVFPDLGLKLRWQLDMLAITVGGCSMAMFCRSFPEPGTLSPAVMRGLALSTVPGLVAVAALIVGGEAVRLWIDTAFVASFIPVLLAIVVAIGQGLIRESRVARFQAAAWSPLLLLVADRIARGLGLYTLPFDIDFAIYYAIAFETVITAIGVADRVVAIRRDRDRARQREKMLAALAETDELTGLPDRRGIMAAFDDEGDARAFGIIDLDHFKKVNDRHGHDTGDRVLRSIGSLLAEWSDITAGRLGGEEFVVFLHGKDPEGAAERLQRAITIRVARDVPELEETMTASMGVVRIRPGQDFIDAYRASDKCLYRAKEAGRNRVVFGSDLRGQPRGQRAA